MDLEDRYTFIFVGSRRIRWFRVGRVKYLDGSGKIFKDGLGMFFPD